MATEELYLENLDEFINDENKIVTYKWLSKTLSVHINQAKQMLFTFVQKQRNECDEDNLNVTYLVAGVVQHHDEQGDSVSKIQIVPEHMLEAAKSKYHAVTSCHVYSIQKSKLEMPEPLCAVDYNIFKEAIFDSNKYSAVKCTFAKPRSLDDIERLNSSSVRNPPVPVAVTVSAKTKLQDVSEKKASKGKQSGVMSMFQNASEKKGKQSGVMSMFQEVSEKKGKQSGVMSKLQDVSEKKGKQSGEKKGKQSGVKSFFPQESPVAQQNKRRRIHKVLSDSSSDEEEEEESKEEPTAAAVEEDMDSVESPLKVSTATVSSREGLKSSPSPAASRRKKRKLVSKTSVNEDGYMVTEKVWEEQSTDEEEDPIPPTPPVSRKTHEQLKEKSPDSKTSPPKVSKQPKKPKQSTLMNFFKKK